MKIPWSDIKREYTQGIEENGKRVYPSQPELARKFGIDKAQIGRRASKEGWLELRQIIVSKISERSQKKAIETISDKGVQFDLECFDEARKIKEKLSNLSKSIDEKTDPYAIKKLNAISYGLTTIQGLAKNALGENKQEVEKVIIEVERIGTD
jgi:hypothetical protein